MNISVGSEENAQDHHTTTTADKIESSIPKEPITTDKTPKSIQQSQKHDKDTNDSTTQEYKDATMDTTTPHDTNDNDDDDQGSEATSVTHNTMNLSSSPPSHRIGRVYRQTGNNIHTVPSAHNVQRLVHEPHPKEELTTTNNSSFRRTCPQNPQHLSVTFMQQFDDQQNNHHHHHHRYSSSSNVLPQELVDDIPDDATWKDVYQACCCHSLREWCVIGLYISALLGLLYFFLVGLDLLGTSFQVIGGCTAGSLLGSDTNPLASVLIGILATAILQSSSTTTSIIVSLVSGGLNVQQGIYMVMGANVGTSITSMLVSLSHMGDGDELERAFTGSSIYFLFNFCTVIILLPLEITTHYLYVLTAAMLPAASTDMGPKGSAWEGPIKGIVSPLVRTLLIANKGLMDEIAVGNVTSCDAYYPTQCTNDIVSYETCYQVGLIACNKKTLECPAFFQVGATLSDDMVSGWVALIVALTILIMCLVGLVALLRKLLLGASTKIIYKATNINPYLAMCIGCGVTILVQSSSITTSTLVPLAGVGVLSVERMYPLVLGADIGTTFTALMAAMVSSKIESLQIALSHLFFNLTGIVIWYPVPFMRRIVLRIAKWLGMVTKHWRAFPILFIVTMFFLLPLLLLGISICFEQGSKGFTALGVFLIILIVGALSYFALWWHCRNGKAKCQSCLARRQRRAAAMEALADDLDYLKVDNEWCKNEIGRIKDFAGPALTAYMEEGRPLPRPPSSARLPPSPPSVATIGSEVPPSERAPTIDDDTLSLFHSCQSKPWRDVIYSATGSVKSGL